MSNQNEIQVSIASNSRKQAGNDFAHTSVYGRVIGHSPSRVDFRDWLRATLYLKDSHIEEVALMGCGIFWLKLSSTKATSDLISQSSTSVGGRIILMVPWYRGFSVADFDTRFRIPRHPFSWPCSRALPDRQRPGGACWLAHAGHFR